MDQDQSPNQRRVRQKPPEGWSFTIKEVANGWWKIEGLAPDGLTIIRAGHDEETTLDRLIVDAWKLTG
jgi:hypothetical protein